jgi:hypothetical protein
VENLVLGTTGLISSTVSSFVITDGPGTTITQMDTDAVVEFAIDTAGDGSIVYWTVEVFSAASLPYDIMFTDNGIGGSSDSTLLLGPTGIGFGEGGELNDPGSWVFETVATPEPTTLLLLGSGLLGLLALAARSKRLPTPASC